MSNKFKILLSIILTVSLSLIGCGSNSLKTSNKDNYDFIKYKDSYVGDNSSVVNILSNLPAHEYGAGCSLQTNRKPYEIMVNYNVNRSLGEDNYNKFWKNKKAYELLEKNAVVLLSLIKNVDVIRFNIFNIDKKSYTRQELEQKYDGDLKKLFKDNDSVKKFLNN